MMHLTHGSVRGSQCAFRGMSEILDSGENYLVGRNASRVFTPAPYRFCFAEGGHLIENYGREAAFVRWAASLKARVNSIAFDVTSGIFNPLRNSLGFAKSRYESAVAAIQGLLFAINPSTIIRRIRAIVVLALKRQAASVSVCVCPIPECRETRLPLIANSYAASTIAVVALNAGVAATMSHVSPHPKEWRRHAIGHTKLSHFGGSK